MDYEGMKPVEMFCPNCDHRCIGYLARDETRRFECGRCGLKMVSKRKGNRVVDLRLTAPPGQSLFG